MPSAEQISWSKWRVIVTSVVALTLLGILVYLLSGAKLFVPKATIRTYLSQTGGLQGGAVVRLNGIGIGWVSKIGFSGLKDPSKVLEVLMTVDASSLSKIPVDSTTGVTSDNALGDRYMEITRGRSVMHVRRGGVLAERSSNALLSRMDLPTFEASLQAIDALLKDIQQGKGAFGELITGETFYRNVLDKVTRVETSLRAAGTEGILGRLISSDELYESLRKPVARLDGQLSALQQGRGKAGELLRSPKLYEDLNAKANEVRRAVDRAASSPFVAGDELYEKWNGKVAALIRAVDDLNAGRGSAGPYLVNTQLYDNLNGSMRQLGERARDFRQNPKKFLRVDIDLF